MTNIKNAESLMAVYIYIYIDSFTQTKNVNYNKENIYKQKLI